MNRRQAMKTTLAATTMPLCATTAKANQDAISPEFQKLLDEHKQLLNAFYEAANEAEKLSSDWAQNRPKNTFIVQGGICRYELDPVKSQDILEMIDFAHSGMPWKVALLPVEEQKAANFKARNAKANSLKAYRTAMKQEKLNREAHGINQAGRDVDNINKKEHTALHALLRFPCKTKADHRAKAEVLIAENEYGLSEAFIDSLIAGMLATGSIV